MIDKLKVITITGQHPNEAKGGAEMQTHMISTTIAEQGGDVTLVTLFSNSDNDVIEASGLSHVAISKQRSFFSRAFKLYKFIKASDNLDFIYVRCLYSFWWLKIISYILRIPIAFHVSSDSYCQYLKFNEHSISLRSIRKYLRQNFYLFWIRFSSVVFCQNGTQKDLLKLNFNINSILVRNGHPSLHRCPEKTIHNEITIVWVAKQEKNPELFLELATEFYDDNRFRFVMIGVFDRHSAEYYKKQEQKCSHFVFRGELENQEVNDLLEKSHVFVNTSSYEGFPNTFIQSWLRGVPVLSFFVNPDNIFSKENIGYCSGDVKTACSNLRELFDNEGQIFKLQSHNAYSYAIKNHDIEILAKNICAIMLKKGRTHNE